MEVSMAAATAASTAVRVAASTAASTAVSTAVVGMAEAAAAAAATVAAAMVVAAPASAVAAMAPVAPAVGLEACSTFHAFGDCARCRRCCFGARPLHRSHSQSCRGTIDPCRIHRHWRLQGRRLTREEAQRWRCSPRSR